MKRYLEKIKELINKKRKILIRGVLGFIIGGCILVGAAGTFIYSKAKNNINYTVEEAQDIALKAISGEVLKVKKNLEIENLSFEYEFKIKDSKNILKEVTVDSKLGVIIEIDD